MEVYHFFSLFFLYVPNCPPFQIHRFDAMPCSSMDSPYRICQHPVCSRMLRISIQTLWASNGSMTRPQFSFSTPGLPLAQRGYPFGNLLQKMQTMKDSSWQNRYQSNFGRLKNVSIKV